MYSLFSYTALAILLSLAPTSAVEELDRVEHASTTPYAPVEVVPLEEDIQDKGKDLENLENGEIVDWTRLAERYEVNLQTMKRIAYCEGQNNPQSLNINYHDGFISKDRGVFQINDYWHEDAMASLGLDYYDEADRQVYAFHLAEGGNYQPWYASKHCWSRLALK